MMIKDRWYSWSLTPPPVSGWYYCYAYGRVFEKYYSVEYEGFLCGGPEYEGDTRYIYGSSSVSGMTVYREGVIPYHYLEDKYSKMMAELSYCAYEDECDDLILHRCSGNNIASLLQRVYIDCLKGDIQVLKVYYCDDGCDFSFCYLEGTEYSKAAQHCWSVPNYILRCPDYEMDVVLRQYWKRQEKYEMDVCGWFMGGTSKDANSAYLAMIDRQMENLLELKKTIMNQL